MKMVNVKDIAYFVCNHHHWGESGQCSKKQRNL